MKSFKIMFYENKSVSDIEKSISQMKLEFTADSNWKIYSNNNIFHVFDDKGKYKAGPFKTLEKAKKELKGTISGNLYAKAHLK